MPQTMGLQFGLDNNTGLGCIQRKFRWLLSINGVSATDAIQTLPPIKSARPSLSFKTMEVLHLNETVYFPSRPEWKPIPLTLIDMVKDNNPVIAWIKEIYDSSKAGSDPTPNAWGPSVGVTALSKTGFKRDATLSMLDGCGNIMEQWVYQNAWPESIEWGDLAMDSSDIVTVDISLRYDRAYIVNSSKT